MRSIRTLLRHPLTGPTVRYGVAGLIVAGAYLGTPLLLNGAMGVPIQIAIPIAYVVAIGLHFNLQRHFVFRHVDVFALSVRQQIGRYAMIGAVQYPATALATAFLPGLLGVSERVVFVGTALVVALSTFLVLRLHVFHPHTEEEMAEERIAEEERQGAERRRKQPDPVRS